MGRAIDKNGFRFIREPKNVSVQLIADVLGYIFHPPVIFFL